MQSKEYHDFSYEYNLIKLVRYELIFDEIKKNNKDLSIKELTKLAKETYTERKNQKTLKEHKVISDFKKWLYKNYGFENDNKNEVIYKLLLNTYSEIDFKTITSEFEILKRMVDEVNEN